MKDELKMLEQMVVKGEPNIMAPLLDVLALMAVEIEELKLEGKRIRESMGAIASGGKQVPLPPPPGGSSGFSIG